MQTTILILSWVGLVVTCVLVILTLVAWSCWLWRVLIENAPHPRALWAATKVVIQLSVTKNKEPFVADFVAEKIKESVKASPKFSEHLTHALRREGIIG